MKNSKSLVFIGIFVFGIMLGGIVGSRQLSSVPKDKIAQDTVLMPEVVIDGEFTISKETYKAYQSFEAERMIAWKELGDISAAANAECDSLKDVAYKLNEEQEDKAWDEHSSFENEGQKIHDRKVDSFLVAETVSEGEALFLQIALDVDYYSDNNQSALFDYMKVDDKKRLSSLIGRYSDFYFAVYRAEVKARDTKSYKTYDAKKKNAYREYQSTVSELEAVVSKKKSKALADYQQKRKELLDKYNLTQPQVDIIEIVTINNNIMVN